MNEEKLKQLNESCISSPRKPKENISQNNDDCTGVGMRCGSGWFGGYRGRPKEVKKHTLRQQPKIAQPPLSYSNNNVR